jgi:hypothetical protein
MFVFAIGQVATSTPARSGSPTDCSASIGWSEGALGSTARADCVAEDYAQAHKLGDAMRTLLNERDEIEAELPDLEAANRGEQVRRQRQIDNDIEAIRGVATIRGWPLDPHKEPMP